jgi:hypothetical protein
MTWHYEIKEYYDDADDSEGARRKREQVFTLALSGETATVIISRRDPAYRSQV